MKLLLDTHTFLWLSLFIECVDNDAPLGEICNTLRGVWGEYAAEGF